MSLQLEKSENREALDNIRACAILDNLTGVLKNLGYAAFFLGCLMIARN